jgi:transposase
MSRTTLPIMPNKTTTVYAGLDVAKASLQLHFQDRQYALANSAAGHKKLLALLEACPQVQIVCEATGGYERPVVTALQSANRPVSILNPGHVRHFALSQGGRAKSDPLDCALLTAYGRAHQPAPAPKPSAALMQMRAMVDWRAQIKEQLTRVRQQSEHLTDAFLRKQQAKLCKHLQAQLDAVEKQLAKLVASSPSHQEQVTVLDQMPGIGFITAITVLCHMPELGQLNRRQAAALTGLAPWTRQSGPWEGQRHIGGGRAVVRRALYMSAVVLAKNKGTALGKFYTHLRAQGKPAKVALTAVMRKLIVQMNQILKERDLKKSETK